MLTIKKVQQWKYSRQYTGERLRKEGESSSRDTYRNGKYALVAKMTRQFCNFVGTKTLATGRNVKCKNIIEKD